MVVAIKVAKKDAQRVKAELIEQGVLHPELRLKKTEDYLYFPLKKKVEISGTICEQISDDDFEREENITLREKLSEFLSDDEMEHLKTSFDSVGTIAILEIDEELESKEKKIAETLLAMTPGIETVVKKVGHHGGTFRTQDVQVLAGVQTTETIHHENGVRLKLDVGKVYFSPRLSTERKRIAEQVNKGENILVMFSGCAPYVCVLAKNTEAAHVTGIEINPLGHQYGEENLGLNKIKNAQLYNGDVRTVVPKLAKTFDRILMPLPKSAEDFLDVALQAAKEATIIHFYAFLHEDDFTDAHTWIANACQKAGLAHEIIDTVRCGQHAPHVFRICVDFRIVEDRR